MVPIMNRNTKELWYTGDRAYNTPIVESAVSNTFQYSMHVADLNYWISGCQLLTLVALTYHHICSCLCTVTFQAQLIAKHYLFHFYLTISAFRSDDSFRLAPMIIDYHQLVLRLF